MIHSQKTGYFNRQKVVVTLFFAFFVCNSLLQADEGMYPMNALKNLNLKKAGFNISANDMFNPDSISLTNALVRVGGCSGSFISGEGLIITNHHCVYAAVNKVSTVENNYLEKGFMAQNLSDEIPVGIECKITRSYEDVSEKVLKGVAEAQHSAEKMARIASNIDSIIKAESLLTTDLKIEISEMSLGRNYVLFRYEVLKDSRLVYVPPGEVGVFGGELDNWEWPRHTGDFAIIRAYSNTENKQANYSKENIPYRPSQFLRINPNGVQEDDLVFILGYPGRTFRHQPAAFIQYQNEVELPFISKWFEFKNETMLNLSKRIGNEERFLEFASIIKRNANTEKNFKGKLQGLHRTQLLEQKKQEDILVQQTAEKSGIEYQNVMNEIDSVYRIKIENGNLHLTLTFLQNDLPYYKAAHLITKLQQLALGFKGKSLDSFWKENKAELEQTLIKNVNLKQIDLEQIYFSELMKYLYALDKAPQSYVKAKNKQAWIEQLYKNVSKDHKKWGEILAKSPQNMSKYRSPMMSIAFELYPLHKQNAQLQTALNQKINGLIPSYSEMKSRTFKDQFIPDANATLRLTYGYIRSFSPNDGELHTPFTSINGILEKYHTGHQDYHLSDNLLDFFQKENYPAWVLDKTNKKPVVCMLYNLDTTGGNSGSPVMDKDGKLVGVNFDRTFTATINDYAWNEQYSRSIAVDIRYVIYIMKFLSGADHILAEMGVNL
jgi:hypothetical protein